MPFRPTTSAPPTSGIGCSPNPLFRRKLSGDTFLEKAFPNAIPHVYTSHEMTQREIKKLMREDAARMRHGQNPGIMPAIGGFARAASLTTTARSESARNAVNARWQNATAAERAAHGAMLAEARARKRKKVGFVGNSADSTERANTVVA